MCVVIIKARDRLAGVLKLLEQENRVFRVYAFLVSDVILSVQVPVFYVESPFRLTDRTNDIGRKKLRTQANHLVFTFKANVL